MSIYDNVIAGYKLNGRMARGEADEIVESQPEAGGALGRGEGPAQDQRHGPLRRAAAAALHRPRPGRRAGGDPDGRAVLGPGPDLTLKIEELIDELKEHYTIIIVTHNMQQAARVSDFTAFFYMGELIEFGETKKIFTNPEKKQTEDYITGRFG